VNDVDWLDDNVFATAGNDHKICIYHSDNRQRPRYILKGHTDDVLSIKWSPPHLPNSQRYLASIADDGQLLVWRLPEYPEAFDKKSTASTGTGAGGGSASPFKREREGSGSGDDYQFDATPKHLVCKWQVVDESESENQRMCTNALGWSQDQVDGKVLLAA
jgi:WD40 repeat protein